MKHLERLNLSGNLISHVPGEIENLEKLTFIDLSRNRLTTLPKEISQLKSLIRIDVNFNELLFLPESIGYLNHLTVLNLNYNQLTTLPDSIFNLVNLINLSISGNDLIELPKSIGNLKNLMFLDLSDNQITKLPQEISTLENLMDLVLSGNPIRTPPSEIVFRGYDAIKDYFRQLTTVGQDYIYEAKLLIVGEGGVGKTTLTRKILNQDYQLHEGGTTEGVEVVRWDFPLTTEFLKDTLSSPENSYHDDRKFRVNLWDFGGQSIYHATHQFFLTKRSLYILVDDTRREVTDFYYWLNVVELLSDNSPLIIVKNEKEDRPREINERQLRGQFANLQNVLSVNLATNRGLSGLITEIKYHLSNLPLIGVTLPATWTRVRDTLEQDPRNYIDIEEYLGICERHGFTEHKDKMQLIGYLHDLGVCLHFQEDESLLQRIVILNPEWATAAVYRVLDNRVAQQNKGRFSRDALAFIWQEEQYTRVRDELLQLMMKFSLCYRIPNSDEFIAPQLLPINQPDYHWDEANNLIMRYTYQFMPKGIITQLIVSMNKWINDHSKVWQSGVVLTEDDTFAEVIEYYGRREIRIRVVGIHRKDLLTKATYELDRIHDSYPTLKVSKLIPCSCSECKNSQEPHFYKYEALRKRIANQRVEVECDESFEMVNVLQLMGDVLTRDGVPDRKKIDEFVRLDWEQHTKYIKRMIKAWTRRLQVLKEQQATYGKDTPPHTLTEIEDIESEIKNLQLELTTL